MATLSIFQGQCIVPRLTVNEVTFCWLNLIRAITNTKAQEYKEWRANCAELCRATWPWWQSTAGGLCASRQTCRAGPGIPAKVKQTVVITR